MNIQQAIALNNFNAIHAAAPVVEYRQSWENGTGYLDHATDEDFGNGNVVSFIDRHARKGILITIANSSVVIFQRYPSQDNLVSNTPRGWEYATDANGNRQRSETGKFVRVDTVYAGFEAMTDSSNHFKEGTLAKVLVRLNDINEGKITVESARADAIQSLQTA